MVQVVHAVCFSQFDLIAEEIELGARSRARGLIYMLEKPNNYKQDNRDQGIAMHAVTYAATVVTVHRW